MSNRILVTGANGQLGSELRDASSRYPDYEFIFVSRAELAIDDPIAVQKYFSLHTPAFCINCAAYTAVDKAESDPETAFLINGVAVGILADACIAHNTKLVHISTDYVFNGKGLSPYLEKDEADPVNLYGASKWKGEQLALQHAEKSIVIRTSWVYSVYGNNFVKTMMRLMQERERINVVDDQVGSPTYAADLANAILTIINSRIWLPGVYHYSNEGVITWYQFALAIKELTESSCIVNPVSSTEYPTPAKRPGYSVLSKEEIKKAYKIELIDWRPSLENCIRKMKR